jgi:hypothetical protein
VGEDDAQGMGVIVIAIGIVKNRRILGDERRVSDSREMLLLPLPTIYAVVRSFR